MNSHCFTAGLIEFKFSCVLEFRFVFLDSDNKMENKTEKISVDKEELRKRLTPLQYQVTQEAATERPFTGELLSSELFFFS